MQVQHRIPSEIKQGIAKSLAGPSALWKAAMLGMFGVVPFGSSLFGLLVLLVERPLTWFRHGMHRTESQQNSMSMWTIRFFLMLLAIAVIGSLFSQQPGNALLTTTGTALAFCLLISGGMESRRSFAFITGVCLPVITIAGLISSLLNIVRYFYYHMDRVYNIIPQNPNATGTMIIITVGLSLVYFLRQKGYRPYLAFPYLLVIGANLMLTRSRGALLGFGAMLVVITLFRRRLIATMLILILLAGVVLTIAPTLSERLRDDTSLFQRIEIWRTTIRMIKDHPIFGVGAGQYKSHFNEYIDPTSPDRDTVFAHNLFLQVAAEFGLAGLLVFCAIIALILAMGFRLGRTGNIVYQGLFATTVGVLVHMQFDNTIWGLDIGGAFWIMIGMIMGFYRSEYGKKSAHSNVPGEGARDEGRARRFEAELR